MSFGISFSDFIILLSIITLVNASKNSTITNFYLEEVRSLSELPLDKLIKIKSSFSKRNNYNEDQIPQSRAVGEHWASSALSLPLAMPPTRRIMVGGKQHGPIRRYEEWDDKGKDSKISKIFQLTLSALSFLAFGGYLLTLIITAIRRNQNNANPGNVIVLSSLTKFKRPKRGLYFFDPDENDFDTERLYRGMIMLSNDFSNHYGRQDILQSS